MADSIKHYQIYIRGKVQGVGFRAFTQRTAQSLKVCGIVRNEPDGSVYAEAEASKSILENFLNLCRRGPYHARVDSLNYTIGDLKNYSDFQILY